MRASSLSVVFNLIPMDLAPAKPLEPQKAPRTLPAPKPTPRDPHPARKLPGADRARPTVNIPQRRRM